MPYVLLHWPTVYNGHLREPVTLTPVAERLAVELSLPAFTTFTLLRMLYMPSLVEISPEVLEEKLLKVVDVFLLFRNYFPLE